MPAARRPLAATLAAGLLALGAGCSRTPAPTPPDCSDRVTKASVLAAMRSWYLFADQVDFNTFGIDVAGQTPAALVTAVVDAANQPDKGRGWSYVTTKAASSQFFEAGVSMGYGVGLKQVGAQLLVSQVMTGSAADQAGFKRGDELVAIAATRETLGLDANQVSTLLQAQGALALALSSGVEGTTRWFRLARAGAATVELSATTRLYSLDPVPLAASPIELPVALPGGGTRTVGYLLLRSFIGPAEPLLRQAFATFKARGITDLIIDLRYNGGGLLSTAGELLDLMGDGRSGQLAFRLHFNAQHAAEEASPDYRWDFGADPANAAAALAPTRVAFIVTEGSASASELVPFALVPYPSTQVAVIGARTHGKPAGQFGFSVQSCDWLLYLLSFQLQNAAGPATYFDGLHGGSFAGATCAAPDDLAHPMGDPLEGSTAAALQWMADGSCPAGPIPAPAPIGLAPRAALGADELTPDEPSLAQRHVAGLF